MQLFKAAGAMVLVAGVALGSAACQSTASSSGAANGGAGSAGTATTAATTTAPAASGANGGSGASTSGTTQGSKARTDVPDSAVLAAADVAAPASGSWRQSLDQNQKASEMIDPDHCDPTPRPQFVDPAYPRNPAWAGLRTVTWEAQGGWGAEEEIVTYTSADAAKADFTKHQGWMANCWDKYSLSDAPQKNQIAKVDVPGLTDAYAFKVDYSLSNPVTSTGHIYTAVILRGNTLSFVTVAASADTPAKPGDPALAKVQKTWQTAADKLGKAFQ